mgnify:CR=1 FL=1
MSTKTNFQTGNEYTLAELFSNNNKIIIPDLQRDYCWGTKDELAKNFVAGLYDYYENRKGNDTKLGLGMFYGYEEPIGHIQLCDGQQRLTTLFLLIGMLNRYSDSQGIFKKYLISEEEMEDDKEPYLLYSIRESTLYFLSDLITHIFFTNEIELKQIKEQAWYFKDYDLDPSIQSMLAVLTQIEEILENKTDINDFGKFLLHDLTFLYYDMGSRIKGEETFVIINTTGEPLTATENLKPILLSKIESEEERKKGSDIWEKWENFFWNNRLKNDTADNGLKEFFRWIMLLSLNIESNDFKEIQDSGKFDFDRNISIQEIDSYFDIILFIKKNNLINDFNKYIAPENSDNHNQIIWFQVLPVIKYIKRWGSKDILNIKRICHFFYNLSKINNVGKAIAELLPEAIRIIDVMQTSDICSFLDITDISKSLLTEEERLKLGIYKKQIKNRDKIQAAFWKEEDSRLWDGEIKTLLLWSTNNTLNVKDFSYNGFINYTKKLSSLLNQSELDLFRRTLLTFIDNDNYPRVLHGYTNFSFCTTESDWKTILSDNVEPVKELLDSLNLTDDIAQQQETLMNRSGCLLKYNLDKLITHKEILRHAKEKNFQWDDDADDWLIIPKEKATKYANLSNYVLYLDLMKKGSLCNSKYTRKDDDGIYYEFSVNNITWCLWFYEDTDGNCCAVSALDRDLAIDIFSPHKMNFELNIRNENKKEEKLLQQLAQQYNLTLKDDERYYSSIMSEKKVTQLLQNMLLTIK